MTTPITVEELERSRAQQLDIIDDCIRTARERGSWTDEDRARYDAAVAEAERLDGDIRRSRIEQADAAREQSAEALRSRFHVPNVAVKGSASVGADVTRSLDEWLWATDETVRNQAGGHNPVEQVIVRSDGREVPAPRITAFVPEHRSLIRNFQSTVADMVLFGLLADKHARTSADGFQVARSHRKFRDQWAHLLRAMDVDTANEGTDWVPTGIGAMLHEKVRAEGKVAPLFTRIDLPTNPWKWPIEGTDATAYRVAEPTSDSESAMTASTPGSVAATFDAEIFGARALFSRSLEADSVVAILPYVRQKLVQAFVAAEEKAILDGDTDGTHQDSDVGASTTDARTAWDGLRKKALAQTVATATSASAANLAVVRKAMGKWGLNPADLAFIVGVSNMHGLLADTNLLTVDKMGPNATLLNGQIGSVFGVPVIVSEHVRETLNASGVYDGITTTKTYMLCVNRREFAIGQRMALDVEVDDSIYRETYQRALIAFAREDFQHIGSAATNEDVAIAYNVTP